MHSSETDTTCSVCHQPCTQCLPCDHKVCIDCLLKLQDNFKVTCPECRHVMDTENLLFTHYKCPRCCKFSAEFFLCGSCDNYLCTACWDSVHSFYPVDQHKKEQRDDTHQRVICDQLQKAKCLDNKIKLKLCQLENSTKTTSLRRDKINQIKNRFDALREELARQETAAILHVHTIADIEMTKLEHQEKKITEYTSKCIDAFYKKHVVMADTLPVVNEEINFGVILDEQYNIPALVKTGNGSVPVDLLTESGKYIPKVTGSALVICVGGGGGGGQGGLPYRGGGGSGFVTVNRMFLSEYDSVDVEIGAGGKNNVLGMPAQDGFPTKFGNIVAKGGTSAKDVHNCGSGASGGGSGSYTLEPNGRGGRGGSCGSDGMPGRQWEAGKGYCAKEFEMVKEYIKPGTGGEGGKNTGTNHPSGGGAGGVVVNNCIVKGEDGEGDEGKGLGGIGFGAGGGGGSYDREHPHCKPGGQGAQGCIIVVYE